MKKQPAYAIRIVKVSSRRIVSAQATTTLDQLPSNVIRLLDRVWKRLRRRGVSKTGRNVVLYRDDGRSVEAGVEVSAPVPETGSVRMSAMPAGRAATTVHWGPYPGLPRAHEAVRQWCEEHGQPLAGANWEVYGDWNDDPEKLRTDVFYLLGTAQRRSAR